MAGIVGVVGRLESKPETLLGEMGKSLCFSTGSRPEAWSDSHAGFCRVRSGADNSETQPIFNRDRTKCIIMFGECFGYEEDKRSLLRQGHIFEHGDNDAEFCLHLYEEYGDAAFTRLSGSFCLAIYEIKERELLLVSDRLGSRPLYYGESSDGRLVFSTQVASVLADPGVSRRLDIVAALEFCTLQRVLGEKTYHEGVRMLTPASVLRYRGGRVRIVPYWYPNYDPRPGTADDYADELAIVMNRVLGHITRGTGRVAMLLSGGLDARMAVAAAGERLICYTFGDYYNPEAETAKQVAKAGGCEFRFLRRDPDHYPNLVETAIEIGNGMYAFNHAHAVGFIDDIARECDVATHGFVPELLFRGYSLPKISREVMGIKLGNRLDPTLTEKNLPQRLFRRGYSLVGKGVETIFTREVNESLEETLLQSARDVIASASSHAKNIYDVFLWPDIYYHARYPSMLFELSLRPFITERSLVFHNEVIDLHLRMPLHLRADNRVWLKAIERLNHRVAHVVDANTGHTPFLPPLIESCIAVRKSLASRMPVLWRLSDARRVWNNAAAKPGLSPISWPRFNWMVCNNAKMRKIVTDTLTDLEALPSTIFDLGRVQILLNDHLENKSQHRVLLFVLLTFGRWYKKYGIH